MLGPNFQELNRLQAADEAELGEMIRSILRLLQPQKVVGFGKARIGAGHDGAYVMLDDFSGIDTALSFGINDNIEWDKAIADRGMIVHQFDHTVDDPASGDARMHFNKQMIAPEDGLSARSLASLIREHDRGAPRPNMILKMDIENWEWPVLEATPLDLIRRFAQITCELHQFNFMDRLDVRQKIFRGLRKLSKFYAPIHVHGNVYGGWGLAGNVVVPGVLEVSFVNRSLYEVQDSDELFPTPLDLCCDPGRADLWLGSFRF